MSLINVTSPLPGLHVRRQAPLPPAGRGTIIVRRSGAIGDSLAASFVAVKLREQGYDVAYQANAACHCVLRRTRGITSIMEPVGQPMANLDRAYEDHPKRRELTFAKMFMAAANHQLWGVTQVDSNNHAPRMVLTEHDKAWAMEELGSYPRPWVMICPRSNSFTCRTVPPEIWKMAAKEIFGTCFWLGNDPAPSGIIDLQVRHLDSVIAYIGMADLMVSVDTGPAHLATAIGTPLVVIEQQSSPWRHFSNQRDWVSIAPNLSCLNCCQEKCPIDPVKPPCQAVDPVLIADTVNDRLQCCEDNGVSGVINIYRPKVEKLNRALETLLPQVDEVVVCSDQAGLVPEGALQHRKIRYIQLNEHDAGYGKKCNFAIRHTNHRFIMVSSDDVYLAPDAVQKLYEVMAPDVAMVGMELRYLDGTIQHANKWRPKGHDGWGHWQHKEMVSNITEPVETESVTGAAILLRREAFYQAGAFDESYWLYSEDDCMCLCIRQAGWKIMYTPHAKGIHEEHQSTGLMPHLQSVADKANEQMRRQWSWWFNLNRGRNGLGVFE